LSCHGWWPGYERVVIAIGRIVNGVAVSVGEAELQIADSALNGGLQGVVNGIGHVVQVGDIAITQDRPERIRIVAAGDTEIDCRLSRNGGSPRPDRHCCAISLIGYVAISVGKLRRDRHTGSRIWIGGSLDRL
jgi:hypothetical protein